MAWLEILKWVALLLVLIFLYSLWQTAAEEWEKEKQQAIGGFGGEGSASSSDQQGSLEDQMRREAERRRQAKSSAEADARRQRQLEEQQRQRQQRAERLRQILRQDPELAKELAEKANMGRVPYERIAQDQMLAEMLAERMTDETLDILDGQVPDLPVNLDLDLRSGSKLKETRSGGIYHDTGPLRDLGQITKMRPGEWAMPKSLRRYRMATGEARQTRRYDIIEQKKKFWTLEDTSGSMEYHLKNGQKRYVGSRKLILKLAEQALAGKTEFVYRYFSSEPSEPFFVTTREQATRFKLWASTTPPSGGGTDIFRAFKQAIEDIQTEPDLDQADILLISDGDDTSMNNTQKVKDMLGDKIRLHVILIGKQNRALEEVASSYQVVQ